MFKRSVPSRTLQLVGGAMGIALAVWVLLSFTAVLRPAGSAAASCDATLQEFIASQTKEAHPYTGSNLVYFLHVPRTGGRTFHMCFLKYAFPATKRCPKAYDHLRINLTLPNCNLLSSHDDFSVVENLPDEASVISQMRDPVDRFLSAYEFAVEVASRAAVRVAPRHDKLRAAQMGKVLTDNVWPWSHLVPFFEADMRLRVGAAAAHAPPTARRSCRARPTPPAARAGLAGYIYACGPRRSGRAPDGPLRLLPRRLPPAGHAAQEDPSARLGCAASGLRACLNAPLAPRCASHPTWPPALAHAARRSPAPAGNWIQVDSPDGERFFFNKALNISKYNLTQARPRKPSQAPALAGPGRPWPAGADCPRLAALLTDHAPVRPGRPCRRRRPRRCRRWTPTTTSSTCPSPSLWSTPSPSSCCTTASSSRCALGRRWRCALGRRWAGAGASPPCCQLPVAHRRAPPAASGSPAARRAVRCHRTAAFTSPAATAAAARLRRCWASPTTRTGPRLTRCASAPGPRAPCTTPCSSLRGGA
jgi:hypothetical protein